MQRITCNLKDARINRQYLRQCSYFVIFYDLGFSILEGGQEGGLVTDHRDLKHKITNHRVFK